MGPAVVWWGAWLLLLAGPAGVHAPVGRRTVSSYSGFDAASQTRTHQSSQRADRLEDEGGPGDRTCNLQPMKTDFQWPDGPQFPARRVVRSKVVRPNVVHRWLEGAEAADNSAPPLTLQTLRLYRNCSRDLQIWHTPALPEAERIPRIVHQMWLGDQARMPWHIIRHNMQMLGANWTFFVWTQHSLRWLPYSRLFHRFRKRDSVHKATDLARFAILYRFGGWYLDSDIQLLRHLEPLRSALVEGADCLAVLCGRDRAPLYIQTSVLGCRPGAVAMKRLLEAVPFRPLNTHDHQCTGPRLLSDAHFRDAAQPTFTVLPTHSFLCREDKCPPPTCDDTPDRVRRYGWDWDLRYATLYRKEISEGAQPLQQPCEPVSRAPALLAGALPGAPPLPRLANALGVKGLCSTMRVAQRDEAPATYLVHLAEDQAALVVTTTEGDCAGSLKLPPPSGWLLHTLAFADRLQVVVLARRRTRWALIVWRLAEPEARPVLLPSGWDSVCPNALQCAPGTCYLLAWAGACGGWFSAKCPTVLAVDLATGAEQGAFPLSPPPDGVNATTARQCPTSAQLHLLGPRKLLVLLPPDQAVYLDVRDGQVAPAFNVSSLLIEGPLSSPLRRVVAATPVPAAVEAPAYRAENPDLLLLGVAGDNPLPVLLRVNLTARTARPVATATPADTLRGLAYLWSGHALVVGNAQNGQVALRCYPAFGNVSGQWEAHSLRPLVAALPFLPTPHVTTEDVWRYRPSTAAATPVTVTVWDTHATGVPAVGRITVRHMSQVIAGEEEVSLAPHWQGTVVQLRLPPFPECDLYFLRVEVAVTAAEENRRLPGEEVSQALGEVSVALYCDALASQAEAFEAQLIAYRAERHRRRGALGLY